ncbi:Glycosyltransferase family 1 protein [Mycena kentingensis (nom. inval.)]|nr:Glycosyltransferase family 1 protein [Mycena kentingensis (nom. inval.)]
MDDELPPAYEQLGYASQILDQKSVGGTLLLCPTNSILIVAADGRIDLDLDKLGGALLNLVPPPPEYVANEATTAPEARHNWHIKLNIVIQVVGSRGDVQPFIALGNALQKHGHRVRLVTHDVFESFVRDAGLEFYAIGGDPAELMAFMVKNPGLIPSMRSLRDGDIQKKRAMVAEMLAGCWRSCIEPDAVTGTPFVAEAIIANPPSFAHIHCAQALGVPIHLMFTMPWSSTRTFSHPLANLKYSGIDPARANWLSYGIVEFLTWQGLGDIINKFRHSIDLEPVPITEGPSLAETLRVPFTYCWSPALIPKPLDWGSHIDICGFFFREPPSYTPPPDLDAFLRAGPPPVYIGFGSIVIDDPKRMSAILVAAVRAAGVRAIISRGWSKLDGPESDDIFWLGDCPHEWLFQYVSAVVHHGGAGTTACGLLNAKPTVIVPFFGDQPFWGKMVAESRAGPAPIPHQSLTAFALNKAIQFCLSPDVAAAARGIADKMRGESGVDAAVTSFYRNLPLASMQCDILPDRCASWKVKMGGKKARISKLAAEVLIQSSFLKRDALKPCETRQIQIENKRWDVVTGGTSAAIGVLVDVADATAGLVTRPYEEYKRSRPSLLPKSPSAASTSPKSSISSAKSLPRIPWEQHDPGEGSSRGMLTQQRTGMQTAGAMAVASGKGVGAFVGSVVKGLVVDVPLAMTEGMRNVPSMYGQVPQDHGQVTGWASGAAVAGKTFATEFTTGLADVFVQPYKGAREEGLIGLVKGTGKGVVNATFKTTGAAMGLVAYPGLGIWRSLRATAHDGTRQEIVKARHREGEWLFVRDHGGHGDAVVSSYGELIAKKKQNERAEKQSKKKKS